MEELGRAEGNRFVRAGTFARSKAPHNFAPQDGLLIIDGLDEVGAASPGDGVDAVLSQLSAIGSPPFVLSSREADWRGAADRIRLEDDYGRAATVLHMQPFDMADANAFLTAGFPSVDADEVLAQVAGTGLAEIYRNPLTLRMIGEVWVADGALPRTRSELLDRACRLMLIEDNPRHQAVHASVPDEDIMLAAGAVCASLLLCDRVSVFNGPRKLKRADDLLVGELSELPHHGYVAAALSTRLFQADGEHRLVPAHRVIAEHLGGRWVGAVHRAGASERRLRSLMTIGGGVPTSLRGLNAWTAHFSEELAPGCIAADPYAVLRYGEPTQERVIDNRASGCPVVIEMDIGDPSLCQLACEEQVSLATIVVDGHVELLVERCQSDADTLRADRVDHGVDRFEYDTRAVLDGPAVLIGSIIQDRVEELLEQIAICGMKFDAVKVRIASIARAANEILDDTCHLAGFESARHAGFDHFGRAIVQEHEGHALGITRRLAC